MDCKVLGLSTAFLFALTTSAAWSAAPTGAAEGGQNPNAAPPAIPVEQRPPNQTEPLKQDQEALADDEAAHGGEGQIQRPDIADEGETQEQPPEESNGGGQAHAFELETEEGEGEEQNQGQAQEHIQPQKQGQGQNQPQSQNPNQGQGQGQN